MQGSRHDDRCRIVGLAVTGEADDAGLAPKRRSVDNAPLRTSGAKALSN